MRISTRLMTLAFLPLLFACNPASEPESGNRTSEAAQENSEPGGAVSMESLEEDARTTMSESIEQAEGAAAAAQSAIDEGAADLDRVVSDVSEEVEDLEEEADKLKKQVSMPR